MCRDNNQVVTKPEYKGLEDEFTLTYGLEEYERAEDLYCATGYDHPKEIVITSNGGFESRRWGLIPSWCKDWSKAVKLMNGTINAIGENLQETASYRGAVKHGQFCVIPVTGFFEFHHLGKEIYPFYIFPKGERLFMFGGLYDDWTNSETGETFRTFTVVTTAANKRMEWIHNTKKRMPLILSTSDAHLWLDREVSFADKKKLIAPYPEELMTDYSVGRYTRWSKERRESPEVLKRVDYPELELAA